MGGMSGGRGGGRRAMFSAMLPEARDRDVNAMRNHHGWTRPFRRRSRLAARGPATGCVIVRCGVCNSPAAYFSVDYEGYSMSAKRRARAGRRRHARRSRAAGAAFDLRGAPFGARCRRRLIRRVGAPACRRSPGRSCRCIRAARARRARSASRADIGRPSRRN